MIRLYLVKKDSYIEITELIETISWSGERTQAARQIDFNILSSPYDRNLVTVNIELGDTVVLKEKDKELFRGYIFFEDKSYNSTSISYTAFDCAIYTLKNENSYNFKGVTPEDATKRICVDFGIPYKDIAYTGISLNKKFIGVKLYTIIMSCYTVATQNNGNKYMILAREGELNVIEKGVTTLSLVFENGVNLLDSSYTKNLDKMVNKVRIVDKDGNLIKDVVDNELLNTYGSFQQVITQSDGKDETKKANSMLKGIESKIKITGFGDTTCITGMGVEVYDSYTGISGLFYIDSDKHTWSNGVYTVDLVLNLENLMDENESGDVSDK